jgi:hypothetical protein
MTVPSQRLHVSDLTVYFKICTTKNFLGQVLVDIIFIAKFSIAKSSVQIIIVKILITCIGKLSVFVGWEDGERINGCDRSSTLMRS